MNIIFSICFNKIFYSKTMKGTLSSVVLFDREYLTRLVAHSLHGQYIFQEVFFWLWQLVDCSLNQCQVLFFQHFYLIFKVLELVNFYDIIHCLDQWILIVSFLIIIVLLKKVVLFHRNHLQKSNYCIQYLFISSVYKLQRKFKQKFV